MTKTIKEVRSLVKKYVSDCWPCVARQPIDLKKQYVLKVCWFDNGDIFDHYRTEEIVWNARLEEGRAWVEDTMKRDMREYLSKKYGFTKELEHVDIGNVDEVLYDIEDTFGVYKDKLTCYTENWRGKKDPTPDEIIDGILDARHEAAKNVLKEVLKDKGVKKAVKKALENIAKK
jgi:hypothetical protein